MFAIMLLLIPAFKYNDGKQISERELTTIIGLVVSQKPTVTSINRHPCISIHATAVQRILLINFEELKAAAEDDILASIKEGDSISIKIFHTDTSGFHATDFLSQYQKIYGLNKNGTEYISLTRRNTIAKKEATASVYASMVAAALCVLLALFVYKPKTAKQAYGQLRIDPIILVGICWVLLALIVFR